MKVPRYELKAEKSLMVFEFQSEGPKGSVTKLIKYDETNLKGVYNLAFGDLNKDTGEINDLVVTNNGDSEKVLATVVSSLYAFTEKHTGSMVYATGSTKARTRLYRMGITKYIDEIRKDFTVYGLLNSEWQEFENGIEYEAFLAKRKKH